MCKIIVILIIAPEKIWEALLPYRFSYFCACKNMKSGPIRSQIMQFTTSHPPVPTDNKMRRCYPPSLSPSPSLSTRTHLGTRICCGRQGKMQNCSFGSTDSLQTNKVE